MVNQLNYWKRDAAGVENGPTVSVSVSEHWALIPGTCSTGRTTCGPRSGVRLRTDGCMWIQVRAWTSRWCTRRAG